jgi:polysaccharide export outer membrane protein
VLGAVSRPGAFTLTPNMSFLEALSKAGGPTEDAAPSKINVIRLQQGTNQQFDLDTLLKGQQKLNVALQEGDILYVPTNTIRDITYATQILNPFSTVLRIFADIETIRANVRLRRIENQQDQLEADKAALEKEKEQLNQQLNNSSGVE